MRTASDAPPAVHPSSAPTAIHPTQDIELAATDPPAKRRRRDALTPGFRSPPPPKTWLRHNWMDITTQLLCLLTAWLMYTFVPPLLPRYFPLYAGIERSAWGLKYGQPYRPEYVNTIVSAVVSFAVPALILGAIGLWGVREFADGNAALIGLGYALATATLFDSFIKILIGGLRPNFLSVCAPRIPGLSTPVFYTASQVCTGDPAHVKEAQMSFPSGHAAAAFAGFGFLALWLNAKFKVFGRGRRSAFPNAPAADEPGTVTTSQDTRANAGGRIQHWKLVLFVAPWCVAFLLAGSKVRDAWHHPVDVVFGAMVGTAFAHMAFRMVYRSVYDWRDNHVPMER